MCVNRPIQTTYDHHIKNASSVPCHDHHHFVGIRPMYIVYERPLYFNKSRQNFISVGGGPIKALLF